MKPTKEEIDALSMLLGDKQENIEKRMNKHKKLHGLLFNFNKDFREELIHLFLNNYIKIIPQIMTVITTILRGFDKDLKKRILLLILESIDELDKKEKELNK